MNINGLTLFLCSFVIFLCGFAERVQADSSIERAGVPEILVTGRKIEPSQSEVAYATTTFNRVALEMSAGARLDDVLRAVPGFGLFRRQSSRAAHPTTQGVSLRGLGPSGAGRTLVLRDGIPENDPFGGWVDWSRIPTATLEAASVTRGGGAGPWGNAALAGVVRLDGRLIDRDGGFFEADAGPHDTYTATLGLQAVGERIAIQGLVHGHRTDGSYLIRADQRGPVDRRAADRGGLGEARLRYALNDETVVRLTGRYSESRLVNGTSLAVSNTRIADGAISILHDGETGTAWEANAYVRDQSFRAVFASVNAARTIVTPALDQFSVPATAMGANTILRHRVSDTVIFDTGADIRFVEGETNEDFQNQGQGFTRRRAAGGEQLLAGVFAEANWQPTSQVLATIGGRVDGWRQSDGIRRETIIASGQVAREDRFAVRDGSVGTVRGAMRYAPYEELAVRLSGYTGFRLPTLNELYRPFRVGNDITEANAALGVERLKGFDLGLEWRPTSVFEASLTYFHAVMTDAVTNVTVQTTPGQNLELGVFVPAGGVLRQRRNIDRIVADGIEADLRVSVLETLRFSLGYLFSDPNVSRSPQQPALVGLRLAQVARHQGTFQATWTPDERITLAAQLRGTSAQYDDDQNNRRLKGYVTADLSAEMAITPHMRAVLAVENMFDRTIAAGRSADGIVSVATPRTARLGLRVGF